MKNKMYILSFFMYEKTFQGMFCIFEDITDLFCLPLLPFYLSFDLFTFFEGLALFDYVLLT